MKLTKWMLAAALALAPAAANAQTYAVWPAATEGQTHIPTNCYGWHAWNSEVVNINGQEVTKVFPSDGGANVSGGWHLPEGSAVTHSQLAGQDLVFDAKVEGTGTWTVRLTPPDPCDKVIEIAADGEFHTVRFNIKDDFAGAYAQWSAGTPAGGGYVFSLIGANLSSGAAFYFTNCRYESAVPMPAIVAEATDVTSSSAVLTYSVDFPEGYTDTAVTINGETAAESPIALTGLQPKTEYTYTIVASGKYEGETYSAEKTVTFTTAREAGDEPVWHGVTDIPGFSATYSITYNADKTLTIEADITMDKEIPLADKSFHIFSSNEWVKFTLDASGLHVGTTTGTFDEGQSIDWEWHMPFPGGLYQVPGTYVAGSSNEAPSVLRITDAAVTDITAESASVSYAVKGADNYTVYYTLNGGETLTAAGSPIALTGLAEYTEYTVELWAEAGELVSKHASVTFKTTRADARDYVWSDLVKAEFKNAFLIGETEDMRRSIFATLPVTVTYRADGTVLYAIDYSAVDNIVGFVPQVWSYDFFSLVKNAETGLYECNFGARELDAAAAISHYAAYSGGNIDIPSGYTVWGEEKEAPVLGEPAGLAFTASKTALIIGEKFNLSSVVTDANGYYLNIEGVEYTADSDNVVIEGSTACIANAKGVYTITAAAGALTATVEVRAIASDNAVNIIAGLSGVTDETHIQGGSVANVTDADRNSQLEWITGDNQEHYLIFDLGDDYYIEAVEVYFEGAYATEFTVTLSNAAPAELSGNTDAAPMRAAAADAVFANTKNDVQHYFTQEPAGTHRYATLRTTKALNNDWGIKVRDMKVYGSTEQGNQTTVLGNIVVDNDAPVEYYNLQGVRVANPSAGIYIRRQGAAVTKVVVR